LSLAIFLAIFIVIFSILGGSGLPPQTTYTFFPFVAT
jgi:hypothetical protein